jgi:putative DNA primase/helicase
VGYLRTEDVSSRRVQAGAPVTQPKDPQDPTMPGPDPFAPRPAAVRLVSVEEGYAPWKRLLRKREDGTYVACRTNVQLLLSHDSAFAGCFVHNDLTGQTELARKLPPLDGILPPRRGPVDSYVVDCTIATLFAVCNFAVSAELCAAGIEAAAHQRCYNPLHDYLRGLEWDGVQRLGTWLSRYLGAPATEYTAAVGRWWLISAIARAFRPGCQADHILVLEGPQGAGKSTAIGILGGPWYLGKIPPLKDYERAAHALAGKWLIELGELDAFRGAGSSQVKDFLTQPEDQYRKPYDRYVTRQPRACVFVGTTNDAHYLRDATGARRFWPVEVGSIDRDALSRDRDQLLAEARVAFEDGATWWPANALVDEVRVEQERRHEADVWEEMIQAWLEAPRTLDNGQGVGAIDAPKDGVSLDDIMGGPLSIRAADRSKEAQTRVGQAMSRLGWTVNRQQEHGVRMRRYWRKT